MYRISAQGELIINYDSAEILISIDREKYGIFESARSAAEKHLKEEYSTIFHNQPGMESPEVHFMSDGNRLKISSKVISENIPDGKVAAMSLVVFSIISIMNSIKGEAFMVHDEDKFTKIKNVEITSIVKI